MPIAQHALGKLFGAAPCRETPEGQPTMTCLWSIPPSYLQLCKERLPLLTAHRAGAGAGNCTQMRLTQLLIRHGFNPRQQRIVIDTAILPTMQTQNISPLLYYRL